MLYCKMERPWGPDFFSAVLFYFILFYLSIFQFSSKLAFWKFNIELVRREHTTYQHLPASRAWGLALGLIYIFTSEFKGLRILFKTHQVTGYNKPECIYPEEKSQHILHPANINFQQNVQLWWHTSLCYALCLVKSSYISIITTGINVSPWPNMATTVTTVSSSMYWLNIHINSSVFHLRIKTSNLFNIASLYTGN